MHIEFKFEVIRPDNLQYGGFSGLFLVTRFTPCNPLLAGRSVVGSPAPATPANGG